MDYDPLQEPPPIPRFELLPPERKSGRTSSWRRRESMKRPTARGGPGGPRRIPKGAALAAAALVVIGLQGWTLLRLARVRADLSVAAANLDEARASLGLLWETTSQLDEDQIAGLTRLADSIRSVSAFAEGEIRLWETAYYDQDRRLNENAGGVRRNADAIARMATAMRTVNTRLDALAAVDETTASRLAALARRDQEHATLFEDVVRRTVAQESTGRDLATTVGTLRQTLSELDTELVALDDRLSASGSAFVQMDSRVEGLADWIDGFRRAGLNGEAVAGRLSALADELRRVRLRVDSIRAPRTGGRITDGTP